MQIANSFLMIGFFCRFWPLWQNHQGQKKSILLRKKSKSIAFSPRSEEKSENDRCRSDNKVRAGESYYDDCWLLLSLLKKFSMTLTCCTTYMRVCGVGILRREGSQLIIDIRAPNFETFVRKRKYLSLFLHPLLSRKDGVVIWERVTLISFTTFSMYVC